MMISRNRISLPMYVAGLSMVAISGLLLPAMAPAQEASAPPQEVVIERVAVMLHDPTSYQVPLVLTPQRCLTVRSPMLGTVQSVVCQPGEKVAAQADLVRLDSREAQLKFQRAQTEFQVAQLGEQLFKEGLASEPGSALKVTIAKHNLDLAELELDRTSIRAPFAAVVQRVRVTPGELVLPGDPLLEIADPQTLIVEVPVDRQAVKAGDRIELSVEDRMVAGKVAAVLPAGREFSRLRDLFHSVASALVVVDNNRGELTAGMAVTSNFVPRHPILEVPNAALINTDDGGRKVQVIRDGFIRDIPISLLGPVGAMHSYVSGRFSAADELVLRSSVALVDGTWVRPKLDLLQASPSSTPSATPALVPRPAPSTSF